MSALDRLEVRGRDSAGLHVLVTGHGLDLSDPTIARLVAERSTDPLFTSGSVRSPTATLASSTRPRPRSVSSATTRRASARRSATTNSCGSPSSAETAKAVVLAHTRWASVGIISEANAHPLNQEELRRLAAPITSRPRSTATSTTTPTSRRSSHCSSRRRSRPTRRSSPRSCPVASQMAPSRSRHSARRSPRSRGRSRSPRPWPRIPAACCSRSAAAGRRLYVGLADDAYVVASEPYGVVEECDHYLRLDGETMLVPGEPGTQGQIAVDQRRDAGSSGGATTARRCPCPSPSSSSPRSRHATSIGATLRTTS